MDRRTLMMGALLGVGAAASHALAGPAPDLWAAANLPPRIRIISDNDYSGDPDGLVQLAHLLLSPTVDVRAVIGSHLRPHDPWDPSPDVADKAAAIARRVAALAGREGQVPIMAGSNVGLSDPRTPIPSAAARAIIAEAMREDTKQPLYVTCGAGLTEIASAWLMEPRIAKRLTLVWIGGPEYPDLAPPPPGADAMEFNLQIDPIAAQVVFNDSDLDVWQVPRNLYRTALVSRAELMLRMRPRGELGAFLFSRLSDVVSVIAKYGFPTPETYILGDSPLVLLTVLQTPFQPEPASSAYVTRPRPHIDAQGQYAAAPDGRPIRVYTRLDTRLLFEDLFAKLAMHGAERGGG